MGFTFMSMPSSSYVKDGIGATKELEANADEIAIVLKMGAKLALMIGYRDPIFSVASLFWEARTVMCCSDRSSPMLAESVAVNGGTETPINVSPPPNVASGWLKIELAPFAPAS